MAAAIAIMPMTVADLEAVARLEGRNRGGWSYEQLESQLAQPGGWQYAARRQADNEPVGYVCGRNVPPESELYRITVHEQCRRQGIGRMLLAYALAQLRQQGVRQCFLECRTSNLAARSLYGGMGFAETGRRKNYYHEPREDAVLMALSL